MILLLLVVSLGKMHQDGIGLVYRGDERHQGRYSRRRSGPISICYHQHATPQDGIEKTKTAPDAAEMSIMESRSRSDELFDAKSILVAVSRPACG